jgi:hypothetical protein
MKPILALNAFDMKDAAAVAELDDVLTEVS